MIYRIELVVDDGYQWCLVVVPSGILWRIVVDNSVRDDNRYLIVVVSCCYYWWLLLLVDCGCRRGRLVVVVVATCRCWPLLPVVSSCADGGS